MEKRVCGLTYAKYEETSKTDEITKSLGLYDVNPARIITRENAKSALSNPLNLPQSLNLAFLAILYVSDKQAFYCNDINIITVNRMPTQINTWHEQFHSLFMKVDPIRAHSSEQSKIAQIISRLILGIGIAQDYHQIGLQSALHEGLADWGSVQTALRSKDDTIFRSGIERHAELGAIDIDLQFDPSNPLDQIFKQGATLTDDDWQASAMRWANLEEKQNDTLHQAIKLGGWRGLRYIIQNPSSLDDFNRYQLGYYFITQAMHSLSSRGYSNQEAVNLILHNQPTDYTTFTEPQKYAERLTHTN